MKARRGFTLLEFIIYFALVAAMMTAVTAFSIEVVRTKNRGAIVAEVEQNARLVLLKVQRSVRRASQLNVGGSTLNADNGVLSLAMSASATDPTVFDLVSGAVRMKEGTGSAIPLTTGDVAVTRLRFSKDNLGGNNVAVTVELTARYDTPNADAYYNYVVVASDTAIIRKD